MSKEVLNQVCALLGEHFRNYVIIASKDDSPVSYETRFSDPYAAKGLMEVATDYHNSYITGVEVDWVTEGDDEYEEDEEE